MTHRAPRRRAAATVGFLVALAVSACGSAEPEVVSGAPRPADAGPADAGSADPRTAERADASTPPAPGEARPRQTGTALASSKRPNGLRVLRIEAPAGGLAQIALYVDAGPARDHDTKPGLARLCAGCLLAACPGGREGETLDATLARLGASLQVTVEGRQVRIECTGPEAALDELAALLLSFVTQPAPTAAVVEAEKRRLLPELVNTRAERLRHNQIRFVLGESVAPLEREELATESAQAAEVDVFLGRYYRPTTSVLAVRSTKVEKVAERLARAFDAWSPAEVPALVKAGSVKEALHFAKTDGPLVEVIAMLRSPRPAVRGDGQDEAIWQLMDADGVAGHLRRRLDEQGFPDLELPSFELDTGHSRVRLYSVHVPPGLAEPLRTAILAACADLATTAPDYATLQSAKRRALFLWDLTLADPVAALRAHATALLLGLDPNLDGRVIQSLDRLRTIDTPALAEAMFVPIFLLRGPDAARPKGAVEVPDLAGELAQGSAAAGHARPLGIDEASKAELTRRMLELAIDKAGTRRELEALGTLSWRQISRYSGSFEIRERWSVELPDGPAQRERQILSTTVVTAVAADGTVTETVGGEKRQLEAGEAGLFRLESRLHPNVLLALVARGKLELKAVSRITLASQSLIVLAGKLGADDVHVAIDEKSGFVRRIDWLEWQPKAAPRRASLELLDYRGAGRLKAPHWLRKFVDGELRADIAVEYER